MCGCGRVWAGSVGKQFFHLCIVRQDEEKPGLKVNYSPNAKVLNQEEKLVGRCLAFLLIGFTVFIAMAPSLELQMQCETELGLRL